METSSRESLERLGRELARRPEMTDIYVHDVTHDAIAVGDDPAESVAIMMRSAAESGIKVHRL